MIKLIEKVNQGDYTYPIWIPDRYKWLCPIHVALILHYDAGTNISPYYLGCLGQSIPGKSIQQVQQNPGGGSQGVHSSSSTVSSDSVSVNGEGVSRSDTGSSEVLTLSGVDGE